MPASDRKSPRVYVDLDVYIQTVDGDVPCKTRDASYEGVFIVRNDPLPLRKLIRFRTHIAETDEELQMLGLVARTVNATDAAELGRDPGMGIQLFSLGQATRQRWRRYIDELYEQDPQARKTIEESQRPSVRIRIPNEAMLQRFRTIDLPKGGLFLRTPELHPAGTEVTCVVSHPTNDQEFALTGEVLDCVEGTVKDRGLQLALHLPEDTEELETFLGGPIPQPEEAPQPDDDSEQESQDSEQESQDGEQITQDEEQ